MKSRHLILFAAITLFAALVIPVRLCAQGQPEHNVNHKLHHYKLMDIGTFGGPTGWLCNDPNGGGGACPILNGRGTVASGADTSDPNPNYLNSNGLLPPFNPPIGDPFIQHAFRWQGGVLQDLGTLPGGYNSFAQAVSENGLVVGLSENGTTDPFFNIPAVHAVLWPNNGQGITDLGTLEGGYESTAFAVNDRAQVVGFALNTIPDPFVFGEQVRAFLWQNGVMQDLDTLGTGTDAFAFFINERGQIAGASFTNTIVNPVTGLPTQDPFLWEKGTMHDLGTLGGNFGLPNALNNKGQVVGFSDIAGDLNAHAFLWDKGELTDLGTLVGASPPSSTASWINDTGEIIGGSYTPTAFHAFLWRRGVMTDLGTVGGDACSGSLGLNSETQVVGFSSVDCAVNSHAFLWEDGQIIDLNIFNYPGSGLDQLLLAYNINDSGEIDGLGVPPGVNPGDVFTLGHVFALIPCDEAHPGVEGCDYSMIDATTAASRPSPAVGGVSVPMLPPLGMRPGYRRHFPGASGPIATLSPTSLAFGTRLVGTSSRAKPVTLSNNGTMTLSITAIVASGDFSQSNNCGSSLAAGASCTISVTFKPTQSGTRTGTVSVTDNAPGSPQTVSLKGTGTVVELIPHSLQFGTVTIGQSKTLQTTLTNVGSSTLSITSITLTGSSEFHQTNTCDGSVGGGMSCTISVTFNPTGFGAVTGDVSISDNGGGSPQRVALSGTGEPNCSFTCSKCPPHICMCTQFGACQPFVRKENARELLDDPKPAPACPNTTQSFRSAASD